MGQKKHIKETKKPKTKDKTENLPPHLKRAATAPPRPAPKSSTK